MSQVNKKQLHNSNSPVSFFESPAIVTMFTVLDLSRWVVPQAARGTAPDDLTTNGDPHAEPDREGRDDGVESSPPDLCRRKSAAEFAASPAADGGVLPSAASIAVHAFEEESDEMVLKMRPSLNLPEHWKWTQLRDCIFVGHTNTDTDSIASSIG